MLLVKANLKAKIKKLLVVHDNDGNLRPNGVRDEPV